MISDTEIQKRLGDDPDNADSLPLLRDRCCLEKGSVIPFVGAGLSKSFGFPLWGDFLKDSAAKRPELLKKIEERIGANQFEEAASDLMAVLTSPIFQNRLAKTFGDSVIRDKAMNGAVAQLARFPVARYITTNFDRVLETCLRQNDIQVRAFPGSKPEYGVEALNQSKPFLLKLHGDWEDFEGRVLTLEEYESAYGDAKPECMDLNRPLPGLLSMLLKTRCMLFLGCSLAQDRTMQVLNQVTKQFRNRIYHFAIVERPTGASPEEADAATQKRKVELDALSIIPVWYPHGNHHLIEDILTYLAEQMEEVFPPGRAKKRGNIPEDPGNVIIGRQTEIAELTEKLKTDRLITILGAGGCGKSRLSMEVARVGGEEFVDGIWYVPLADLSVKAGDDNLLPSWIGRVIGIPERPTYPPNEALLDYFGKGKQLLVLDNCEHLIESCREVAVALLNGCPALRILATSRAVLNAYPFERLYPLNPLTVPGGNEQSAAEVRGSSAVEMFRDRARARVPNFEITSENANAVATICQALCGIPLAIEIAAAQVREKTVQTISRDISSETFDLLDESSDGNLRQWKTMRAAIAWSYNSLAPELQVFFRRLSVFRGGWTNRVAMAVCHEDGESDQDKDQARRLLDNSLIVSFIVDQEMRFRFLEPIRQFAQQQLTAAEADTIERRHAEWFLGAAEEAAPKYLTGEQNATLDATQRELDNFRAAVEWAIDKQQPQTSLRLMVALWRFMEIRGYYTEGLVRATKILAMKGVDDFPTLKCKLLSGAGMLAYRMARFERADELFQECLETAKSGNDRVGIAEALSCLGLVAMMKGDAAQAQSFQTQCRDMERLNNNARNVAVATYNLGFIALGTGNNAEATRLLTESLKQFESAQNGRESAFALNGLARCCIVSGDLDSANRYAQKSLEIRRQVEDSKCIADSLRTQAWAALEASDYESAVKQLKEAIVLARGVDDSRGVSEALDLFALISGRQENKVRLVELAAAAGNVRGQYGYALPPALIAEREGALAKVRESLGEQEYSRAWSRGGVLGIPEAIDEALHGTA